MAYSSGIHPLLSRAGTRACWALVAFSLHANSAVAAEQIGIAITVRNEVTGKLQMNTVAVNEGSDVFGKELVKTANDSSAKLVLKDNTNLNLGPSSSITLDKFVFAGPSDYKKASFNVVKGAFRFTSGLSDKRAYDIRTPTATIGIRGTDFSAVVGSNVTHIEVTHGDVIACPRVGGKCLTLTDGQAANITNNNAGSAQFTGEASAAACNGPCETPTSYEEAAQSASSGGQAAPGTQAAGLSNLAGPALVGAGIAGAAAGAAVAASNNGSSPSTAPYIPQPVSGQ